VQLRQYQYYSVGLLSNCDKFYDHQKLVVGSAKRRQQVKQKTERGTLRSNRNSFYIFIAAYIAL